MINNYLKKNIFFSEIIIIASIYTFLTLIFSFISFGIIQFRIADSMIVLIRFKKSAFYGLVLGCFLSNLFSTIGLIDIFFGTFATLIGLFFVKFFKNKNIIYIFIFFSILNSIVVGIEFSIVFKFPFILNFIILFCSEILVFFTLGNFLNFYLKKIKFKNNL